MTALRNLYRFETKIGPFYIAEYDQRFHIIFNGESLGGYHSPKAAAEEVAGGYACSIARGIDTATLGIPNNLSEWEEIVPFDSDFPSSDGTAKVRSGTP
jgi:hypothetical protein